MAHSAGGFDLNNALMNNNVRDNKEDYSNTNLIYLGTPVFQSSIDEIKNKFNPDHADKFNQDGDGVGNIGDIRPISAFYNLMFNRDHHSILGEAGYIENPEFRDYAGQTANGQYNGITDQGEGDGQTIQGN